MNGGELVGEGSKTCVFRPNLPCINKNIEISDDKISKVFLKKNDIVSLKKEIDFNKKISKLEKSDDWTVTLFNLCELDNYEEIIKIEKDMKKCLDSQKVSIQEFNKNKSMLYGSYGGIPMKDSLTKLFVKDLNKNLINIFLKSCYSLFYGLNILNKNNILHYDIKQGNIVYHNNKYKYIDYGISTTFDNTKTIKDRAVKEYKTNRIYMYYPYELFYIFIKKDFIDKELKQKPFVSREHHDYLVYLNKTVFDRDINKEIIKSIQKIKENKITKKEVIEKLDVYSLGITILITFMELINNFYYTKDLNKNKNIIMRIMYHPSMLPVTNLLKKMTEPSCDIRLSSKESLKQFEDIINNL